MNDNYPNPRGRRSYRSASGCGWWIIAATIIAGLTYAVLAKVIWHFLA
jgi:hypothetical protein